MYDTCFGFYDMNLCRWTMDATMVFEVFLQKHYSLPVLRCVTSSYKNI